MLPSVSPGTIWPTLIGCVSEKSTIFGVKRTMNSCTPSPLMFEASRSNFTGPFLSNSFSTSL